MARAALRIQTKAVGLEKLLTGAKGRARDLSPYFKGRGVAAVRLSVGDEFHRHAWLTPRGGIVPWRDTQPFGTRPKPKQNMIATGAYFRALMGRGPGSLVRVGPRSFDVGVEARMFPGAAALRGGKGGRISTAPLFIRPKTKAKGRAGGGSWVQQWAMWWRLGLTYGVWLKEETLRRGLKLYPRPHLTANPKLTRQLARGVARWIAKADLREAAR
jgi:hypothetical protein